LSLVTKRSRPVAQTSQANYGMTVNYSGTGFSAGHRFHRRFNRLWRFRDSISASPD
jgi:hypothetical protein